MTQVGDRRKRWMTGFFVSFGKYISFCIFVIPNSSYLPTIPIEQENWTPEVAIFAVSTYVITLVNFHVQLPLEDRTNCWMTALQSLTGKLQGRINTQGDPCSHYRE